MASKRRRDVARGHRLVDRHLAEDRRRDDAGERQHRPALRERQRHHRRREDERQRQEDALQRRAVEQPPDGELGRGAAQRHRESEDADDRQEPRIAGKALLHQLRDQDREGVENEAGDHRDQEQHEDCAADEGRRDLGKGPCGILASRIVRRLDEPCRAEPEADQPRHDERRAPADLLRQERGHDRRQRDAEIAEHAVDADRAPDPVARRLDQHRGADRMVDRREQPGRRKRQGERQRARCEPRRRERKPGAEEERRHHGAAAEPRREPPLRQRADPVEHEHAGRERDDRPVFGPEFPSRARHREHRRRQDQERVVGQQVGGVDENDLAPRGTGHRCIDPGKRSLLPLAKGRGRVDAGC